MAQSADFYLTVIGGSKFDGSGEACDKLVDGLTGTKWGQTWRSTDKLYVVMKGSEDIVPKDYYIITGADTGEHPERNWRTWYIYAGNFASDAEATEDAEGWTLIDSKENVGDLMIPGESGAVAEFTVSENVQTTYKYFKIVVTQIQTLEEGIYMQMAEFNFGKPGEAIAFNALLTSDRDGNLTDNEGAQKLVDGFTGSKWGFGNENIPDNSWLVFKATQPFAPTYYTLFTGNDTGNYGGERNWWGWEIYGGNFESDGAAVKDAPGWVLIDRKNNDNHEILPAVNATEFFFTLSEEVKEKYTYFKVQITKGSGGYVQMAELELGTDYTLNLKKMIYYRNYLKVDLNVTAYKPYIEAFRTALDNLNNANDASKMNDALKVLREAEAQIAKSVNAYKNYESTVGNITFNYAKMSNEGQAFFDGYIKTNAGPSETYPNGTYLYIIENCMLDDEGLREEGAFLGVKLEQYMSNLTEGAIDVSYEPLTGTAGYNTEEDFGALIDGNETTKWCTASSSGWFIVFKTSDAIAPTYYRLVTGNDTGSYPSRNWKNFKIYGANFETDEAATYDAEGWVLLDDKQDAAGNQIPNANFAACYLYLSNPSDTPYKYFKIEISAAASGDMIQMTEFAFQNTANFYKSREDYVAEFSALDFSEMLVQPDLVDQYTEALEKLKTASNVNDLATYYSRIKSLYDSVIDCDAAYQEYRLAIEDIAATWINEITEADPAMANYFDADNAIEPNNVFTNGNFAYIIKNRPLSPADVRKETAYWNAYVVSLQDAKPIVLDGNTSWGDNENWYKLIDDDLKTKWGGGIPEGGSYLIFKFLTPQQPFFYTLVTGGDTGAYYDRNWKEWKIYGGNFESNGEATRDAEGWVLLSSHEEIGQDRLPAADNASAYFGFTEGLPDPYKYFRIEITKSYSGSSIQMTEMSFGSKEEFEEIRSQYAYTVSNFDTDVIADVNLTDQYGAALETLEGSAEMEELFANYKAILDLQDKIKASENTYMLYMDAVDAVAEFLGENELEDSEALTILQNYIDGDDEPNEVYPNGAFNFIFEMHELNDSTIHAEIDFLHELQANAVRAGYVAGTEVTSMVVNPDFSKAEYPTGNTLCTFLGWDGKAYTFGTNNDGSMAAAENVHQRCDISQTLTGLKNGIYELRMNAGYRPCGDIYSTNYAAQLYANDNMVYVQGVIEDMIPIEDAVDGENCRLSGGIEDKPITDEINPDTIGYVIWGVAGSATAFKAGRYQNAVVVNVTDGTLTIGIKDPGTSFTDNEWLGFGNTKLIYRGELGSESSIEGIDNALESAVARANKLIESEGSLSGEEYRQKPYFASADREALSDAVAAVETATTAEEKYALVCQFSDIFKRIYTTKAAYVKLFEGEQKVYEKWSAHYNVMDATEADAFEEAVYGIEEGIMDGSFTEEEALKAKTDLYEQFPDYLEYTQGSNATVTETAPFAYDILTTGNMPFIAMNGLYEDLADDRTVLTIEYMAEADVVNGFFYFDNNTSHSVSYASLPASAEWKKAYFDITDARTTWNWGAQASAIRWAMTTNRDQTMKARHIRVITKAQMEAEGGSFTETAIERIASAATGRMGIYTITGLRVEKPTRGLYIINGKKVLVK
ncbi:MAG: hypothetical protein K5945_04040 [Bacteroidaceae bacterium]|nr:hypothetical protein [Bacteroidaceae bacterium]